MIVLLGESASGKSTIEKELAKYGYEKIISYTTRKPRKTETNGVDYHYISEEKFKELDNQKFFAEKTTYNGWHYAIAKEDCINNSVIVVEPHGFRQLKRIKNLQIISFYIKVSEHERLIRIAKRGDSIMEIFRRVISDQGVFQCIDEEVDYVIENYDLSESINKIIKILREK